MYADEFIPFLIDRIEGVESNDPDDPGGHTVWGISKRWHPEMYQNGPPTREQAEQFYRDHYKKLLIYVERIQNKELAYSIFDHAVNEGTWDSVRILQSCANEVSYKLTDALKVDGVLGPRTLYVCNVFDHYEERNGFNPLLIAFQAMRACVYMTRNPKYARGWLKRTRMSP